MPTTTTKKISTSELVTFELLRDSHGLRVRPPGSAGARTTFGASDSKLVAQLLTDLARQLHRAHSVIDSLRHTAQAGESGALPEGFGAREVEDICAMASDEVWEAHRTCELYSDLFELGLVSSQLESPATEDEKNSESGQ